MNSGNKTLMLFRTMTEYGLNMECKCNTNSDQVLGGGGGGGDGHGGEMVGGWQKKKR
jgi:hypothetical protein